MRGLATTRRSRPRRGFAALAGIDALWSFSIPDRFFSSAMAVCTRLAWARFIACLAVEGQPASDGRVPRRVPGAWWGGRRLASNLVAAALLLLPGQGAAAATLAATPAALVHTIHTRPPLQAARAEGDGRLQPAVSRAAANAVPGLLAAGVVALLAALGLVQQRRRRAGRRVAPPEEPLARTEAAPLAGDRPEQERPPGLQRIVERPEVEVRVLGRVEIAGIDRIERGKSEELAVFLAFHPDGVDADQLSEALWPGRLPARGTLNTTTAVARANLGMTPRGTPRLPHARSGLYRLDPSVGLDWSRFQALAARGYGAGDEGAEDLRGALELVRGRPFEAARPRSYGWAQLEEVPVMEAAIVDLADHLAGLLLGAGDLAGAQWAARRGLATAPYDERLYRWLMLIADASGNPAGVEAVMDELLLRLDEEHLEPYDSLHEETRALYQRLLRHRATHHRDAG